MPKTFSGKLAAVLILVFLSLFILFQALVVLGQRGGETFWDNLFLAIPIFLAGISAILAFCIDIFSVVKSKERSFLVYLSILIGLFVLIFVIGEIAYPH